MKNTVDYTFNDYPNVQLLVYKGADGTYETDLDKILSDLVVGKNKYGHTTVVLIQWINMLTLAIIICQITLVIG